ncbi:MAG: tetratricopeptide repeat protein [Elusimicrobiota bacterium]
MMFHSLKVFLPILALGLSACVTREDLRGIQTDLFTIQKGIESRLGNVTDQTENVQTTQADLLQEIKDLSGQLARLQTELGDYQQRMSQMSVRLDDLESSLTARMDSQIELLSGSKFVEKPSPSAIFSLANTDFSRNRCEEANKGFESYIKQFPKGDKVPESRLKMGECYVKLKNTDAALYSFDSLLEQFPKHSLASVALFKKASLYESLGKISQAKEEFSALLKNYPNSSEARLSQDKIRSLENK